MTLIVRREQQNWGQLGPAMRALPNDQQRAFVEFYLIGRAGYGAATHAARRAGYGKPASKPSILATIASRLMRDERIVAAIAEESRKIIRAGAPEAVTALLNMIRNPEHKDHSRAVGMVLDRVDPITSHQHIEVLHKHVDAEVEALEELRALRTLGTAREKLLELFGGNGLARLEAAEAADNARRAQNAKVIEGEAIEIEPERQEEAHG
jgi:phage terminase small subunit